MPEEARNRIQTYQAFCSQKMNENYGMVGHDGTAHKISISSESGIPSVTLPYLLNQMQVSLQDIELIKVDTDGFDYEVILGMEGSLIDISPVLFWENVLDIMEIDSDQTYSGYTQLSRYLPRQGYNRFFIFDNYGVYLGEGDASFYQDINEYLHCLCLYDTAKTFFYVDVLACKDKNVAKVREIVREYRSCKWMSG